VIVFVLAYLLAGRPVFAKKLYSYEPPMIDSYAIIYVDNGSCSAGKVLKIRGAVKNHRRKKS